MSFNYVTVYYGPSESVHSLHIHKPQKLRGLKDRLQKMGYRVDLIPVDYINYCLLEMCGFEVFRCNIQNLRFNTLSESDPVCQRAIEAVVDSSLKLKSARSYLLYWKLISNGLFCRSENAPKDYWPAQEKEEEFVTRKNDNIMLSHKKNV